MIERIKRFWYWIAPWYSKMEFYGSLDGDDDVVWCRIGCCEHGRSVNPVNDDLVWFVYDDGTVVYREGTYAFGEDWKVHDRATEIMKRQRGISVE